MIWNSGPWKDELERIGTDLDRRRAQRRWTDRSLAIVERSVMVGFYMVRKLMEARKLSDNYAASRLRLRCHPRSGPIPDPLNWHQLDRFYDLEVTSPAERDVGFVCNQVVHSFVFVVSADRRGLEGFFVASDRARSGQLYFMSAESAVSVLLGAARDDASSWQGVRGRNRRWMPSLASEAPREGSEHPGEPS